MSEEQFRDDMQSIWQSQPPGPPNQSPDDPRGSLHEFERRIFWRNVREYVAGAIVVAAYGFYAWKLSGLLLRIGSGLIILGTIYVMYQLHRRGSAAMAPSEMGRRTCLEFHRRELVRQRDALRAVWSWYLLPFVPGLSVFLAGLVQSAVNRAETDGHPHSILQVACFAGGSATLVAAIFAGIWLLNQRSATRLQLQIDELGDLARDAQQQG